MLALFRAESKGQCFVFSLFQYQLHFSYIFHNFIILLWKGRKFSQLLPFNGMC